ncbi:hypothetical protein CYMTET_33625 [Cymbomonas tetramitiformis]|uniref:Exonuclease domain-containing protein n=1 Tax=Cymbomonas tetramitiformis TaxID=36881 RepID=A0AAE0KQS4_9CHLO|nr:hypothetical protein CYMTET_33625 [Cymbomonas tetramitiformis]
MSVNYFAILEGEYGSDIHDVEEVTTTQSVTSTSSSSKKIKNRKNKASKASSSGDAQQARSRLKAPLVWVDLEMTGLDLEKDVILEIAVIITDGSLHNIFEGPELTIHHSDMVLDNMNEWCVEQHGKSGLTEKVRQSRLSMQDAEAQGIQPKEALIAGNSVHVDFNFLKKDMKQLAEYFHYRIVDVSSVKELCKRWYPAEAKSAPMKSMAHTAMSDIRESIEELKYLRGAIFKPTC